MKDMANSTSATPSKVLKVKKLKNGTESQAVARILIEPHARHALTASTYAAKVFEDRTELEDIVDHMKKLTDNVEAGDLAIVSNMLAAQALSLDGMFTELAQRAALNVGEYVNAAERYGRLALKAQSNCRATLETLVKLHQPREQTVRHVHVNDGGQAIVTEQFHQHSGGKQNDVSAEQSHATGTAEKAGGSTTLLGQDPSGNGMPVPGGSRAEAMPNARRDQPRRSSG
tara:strand:- start:211 stop:897 length:687 start_codon:yes stop_codon:yes gene_type:complete